MKLLFRNTLKLNKYHYSSKLDKKYIFKFDFVSKSIIEGKITSELNPSRIEVVDMSGNCGTAFQVYVKSEKFNGLTLIAQHKLLNKILEQELKEIHSIQYKTEQEKTN